MAYCKKCGAYIPIDETACPACGYDPEEEARQAREAEEAAKRALEAEKAEVLREAENFDRGKRQFITLSLLATTAAISRVALGDDPITTGADVAPDSADSNAAPDATDPAKPDEYGLNPFTREHTISPPGSVSHERFQNRCVGCHLCVSKCPQRILKPSGL